MANPKTAAISTMGTVKGTAVARTYGEMVKTWNDLPDAAEPDATIPEEAPPPERPSNLGLFAVAVAFLLPVLYSPSVSARYWIPRYALALVVAGVGLVLLLAKPSPELRVATWGARAFILAATLSTALSGNPDLAIAGRWNQGTGLLFLIACVGAWAVGVRLTEHDRALLRRAILAAVAVNVVAAILSMAFDLGRFGLERLYGRAMGMLGNPVHLGPFTAAAVALLMPAISRRLWVALAVVPMAAAIGLAGSPAGVALLFVPVVWGFARFGWRPAFGVLVAAVMGLLLVPALDRPSAPVFLDFAGNPIEVEGGGQAPAARSLESSFGGRAFGPRIETWKAGAAALVDRPVFGYGPGMYGEATVQERSLAVVRAYPNALFSDAHNFLVELTTTTGLLGLLTLAWWLVAAAVRARGALALFALIVGVGHLYQPQFIPTALPALFALGAASTAVATPIRRGTAGVALLGGGVGLAAGSVVLLGGFLLNQARLDFDLRDAERASGLLPAWAEPLNRQALIHQYDFVTGDSSAAEPARLAFREATRREPLDPEIWYLYGDVAQSHGEIGEARAAYRRSLSIDPWSRGALLGLTRLELRVGDIDAARRWLDRATEIDPDVADNYEIREIRGSA